VIAQNLTDAEIRGLGELFKGFDTDNSGTITLAELSDGLKSLSLDPLNKSSGNNKNGERMRSLKDVRCIHYLN
jgi:Ca2+-binding EF-hand superfamily protein